MEFSYMWFSGALKRKSTQYGNIVLSLRDSQFTRHFQECNPAYKWEGPVYCQIGYRTGSCSSYRKKKIFASFHHRYIWQWSILILILSPFSSFFFITIQFSMTLDISVFENKLFWSLKIVLLSENCLKCLTRFFVPMELWRIFENDCFTHIGSTSFPAKY